MFADPDDHETDDHHDDVVDRSADTESYDPWNAGRNEDTGNTVSLWPAGRYYDNGTWDEVRPT